VVPRGCDADVAEAMNRKDSVGAQDWGNFYKKWQLEEGDLNLYLECYDFQQSLLDSVVGDVGVRSTGSAIGNAYSIFMIFHASGPELIGSTQWVW